MATRTKMIYKILLFFGIIFVAACSHPTVEAEAEVAYAMQEYVPDAPNAITARADLVSTLEENFLSIKVPLAKSIVLLSRDTKGSRAGYLCEAYSELPDALLVAERNPAATIIPTYWPLTRSINANSSCKDRLANYDFREAAYLLQRFGLANSRGPVLLVMDAKGYWSFIDMHDGSEDQIKEATRGWLNIMASNGMENVVLDDRPFYEWLGERAVDAGRIGLDVACQAGDIVLAHYSLAQPVDLRSASTYLTDDLKLKPIDIRRTATTTLGGPLLEKVCPTTFQPSTQPAVAVTQLPSTSSSLVDELERLIEMRNNGDITVEEFQRFKERLTN